MTDNDTWHEGTLKLWLDAKGYGFLVPDQAGPDAFLHITALQRAGIPPTEGARYRFTVRKDRQGRFSVDRIQSCARIEA